MDSFISPENTIDKGITKRGKYTLPNILALSLKTVDVLVKHSEK